MPRFDALEQEAFDHFKTVYVASAEDNTQEKIYQIMLEHMYGPGARDPQRPVDWDRVFGENGCPECADMLSLREKEYVCGKCGLRIPVEAFDQAVREYKAMMLLRQEGARIRQKMADAGYDKHRISMLYKSASEEGMMEVKARQRRRAEEEKKPRGEGKSGSSVRPGGAG